MHAMKRVFKFLFQCGERSIERRMAGNQYIVEITLRMRIYKLKNGRLESPSNPVSDNGASKLFGHGETEPGSAAFLTVPSIHRPRLAFQNKARARPSGTATHSQEFCTLFECCERQRLLASRLPFTRLPENIRR